MAAFIKSYDDSFNISGACYPEGHCDAADIDADIENLKKKVDAGVTHLVSQLFFDNNHFYEFMEMCIRDRPVGDVCGRLFNIDGKFVEEEYNNKLIGVDERMLRKVGNVMAIAAGPSKCVPIIGALRTELIHYLATDENTVIQLLELMKMCIRDRYPA